MGKFKHYYLTKIVENEEWHDKDWVIEQAVFNSLIEFWEENGENGEEHLRFQFENSDSNVPDDHRKRFREAYDALKKAYEWAKIRDTEQHKSFEESNIKHSIEMEITCEKMDTEHLLNIIKYRSYMWV